jgi:hypothetical protein
MELVKKFIIFFVTAVLKRISSIFHTIFIFTYRQKNNSIDQSMQINNKNLIDSPQYLNVPYSQKDLAKSLGAKWDNKRKSWFVPNGVNTTPFIHWITERIVPLYQSPNIRSNNFYIVKSKEICWKCSKLSEVFAFFLPSGHEKIEYWEYEPCQNQPPSNLIEVKEWIKAEHAIFVTYVDYLSEYPLKLIKEISSNYYYDFSKTTSDNYYMNHCKHCGSKQGDFFMYSEPGGAFCPSSKIHAEEMVFSWYEANFEANVGAFSSVEAVDLFCLNDI